MKVGILKEIKKEEYRVAMTPSGAEVMRDHGHAVLIESGAGARSGFDDGDYVSAGAEIVDSAAEVYERAEMVMHVKEPQPEEYELLREGQVLFTFLHLAASRELTEALMRTGSVCLAYETIQQADGSLPLLIPMSEVAGRMSVQEAAKYLEMSNGGEGKLLGGVPGVPPCNVLIIGGGVVGTNAARIACGMGAEVYLLDTSLPRLRHLSEVMPKNCFPVMSTPATIRKLVVEADVVIGAVLIPGAKAPRLITRDMLTTMKKGAVIVDVAIDQGGCFETSKPTTHADPIYVVDDVVHYCVANMPGAVARTSTIALTNATLSYAVEIADRGWREAVRENSDIRGGANVVDGRITRSEVAGAFDMEYTPVEELV